MANSAALRCTVALARTMPEDSGQTLVAQMAAAVVRNPGPYLVDANDQHKVWPTQACSGNAGM